MKIEGIDLGYLLSKPPSEAQKEINKMDPAAKDKYIAAHATFSTTHGQKILRHLYQQHVDNRSLVVKTEQNAHQMAIEAGRRQVVLDIVNWVRLGAKL